MDGPGTYSQPPYAGGSKDESGTAAKDTISIGSGDRVSGADRMGMEVHYDTYDIHELPQLHEAEMKLLIGETEVPVTWEENASVEELRALLPLTIDMSMYGGFEQVGSIGQSITSDDQQITTAYGDVVLYSGDQLVIFYSTNSWA